MNAIEAMQAEIEYQLHDLQEQHLPATDKHCLFVGSGDSYVAGLAAQHLSGGRALCCYPTDLIQNPSMTHGRNVYIVSISGNTKANLLAARATRKGGARTTAITAKPASRLARACDRKIELKFRNAGVATAGTISFMSSMLTCMAIVTRVRLPDLDMIYKRAERRAEEATCKVGKGTCFILGDNILYPAAVYAALKFNEVFGAKAFPYSVEEFCHSPLFSIKKSDQIIIMGKSGRRLDQRLNEEGFSSTHVDFKDADIRLLMESIFFMQLLVLKLAQKRGLTSCYFTKNSKLLKTSSSFIY